MACAALFILAGAVSAQVRIRLVDGRAIEVEEAWEDKQGVWYRRDGITHLLERSRVRRIERDAPSEEAAPEKTDAQPAGETPPTPDRRIVQRLWVHLVGGARMEVDAASESTDGVWYKRGNMSAFIEKSRVERVELVSPANTVEAAAGASGKPYGWSTGNASLDGLIRDNGARHGVDPYLIFLVMEQESQFNARALSPKGARGLMQLMPGTARRFGVNNVHDPAQNVSGGTRYLRELLNMFGGRVELALASYNAGEGAVMRYGNQVPPYRETRNYVKKIGTRYGRSPSVVPTQKSGAKAPPASAP